MDWIEEVFRSLREKNENSGLTKSMLNVMFLYLLGAIVAYLLTRNLCYSWIRVIVERYSDMEVFERTGVFTNIPRVSTRVQFELIILKLLYMYGLSIYLVIAGYLGIRIFMKKRVVMGLKYVKNAVQYLELGDYSHEPSYLDQDEIGEVSREIELLRKQLVEEKRKEWELQAEQSSINAAFAHDLRTPLTVMKGYTEFLLKYVPQGKVSEEVLIEKLTIMNQHQERLLEFSKTMTTIQSMEMRELRCKWITKEELIEKLTKTAEQLAADSGITIHIETTEEEQAIKQENISVDDSIIYEVCENLMTNALRYAHQSIEVKLMFEADSMIAYIKDDGCGFTPKALKAAKSLYYSEEKGTSNHFGMGLYICEKLCEKHGGKLTLINGVDGGAVTAAEFHILYKS